MDKDIRQIYSDADALGTTWINDWTKVQRFQENLKHLLEELQDRRERDKGLKMADLDTWEAKTDILFLSINYPRVEDSYPKTLQVSLMDVRAANDLRVNYDFERNGWVIARQKIVILDEDGNQDSEWPESAFVPAYDEDE